MLERGTALPLDGPAPPESDQVQLVTKAFYRFATGLEPGQMAGGVPPLLRWSKFGGEELSRIVDRCLAPGSSKAALTTLSALNIALGRERAAEPILRAVPQSRHRRRNRPQKGKEWTRSPVMMTRKELLRRDVVEPVRNPEPYRRYGLSIRTVSSYTARPAAAKPTLLGSSPRSWDTTPSKSSHPNLQVPTSIRL